MQKSAESRKTTVARRWPSSVTVIESVSSSIAHTHAAPSRWLGRVAVAILRLGFRVRVGAKVRLCGLPPDVKRLVVEPEEREDGRPPRGTRGAVRIQHKLRAHVRRRELDRQ